MRLDNISGTWDMIVAGGGITGAGVLREAVRMGLRAVLVEKNDFAWGTSSRSSKLVHGGLRYLKQGRLHLTWESVRHRQRLLAEAPGLVEPIGFLMPVYSKRGPGRWSLEAGLTLYDLMAGRRYHHYYGAGAFSELVPGIDKGGLCGGFGFMDAQVDDARLVLRLIDESVQKGAAALNYTSVTEIRRDERGEVSGASVVDTSTGQTMFLSAPVVINATGSWAETLHASPVPGLHLRPLRGSHLMLPSWRLPVYQAVTLVHPDDGRPLFIIPWEGALMLGTTDIDHGHGLEGEIVMDKHEAQYMIECLRAYFPGRDLGLKDCVSSYSGIRPVLSKADKPPSQESREHVVWKDRGLVTVTGGKLTTFRALAKDALKAASDRLPGKPEPKMSEPVFDPAGPLPEKRRGLSTNTWQRLLGRYGQMAGQMVMRAEKKDLSFIPGTLTLWAELPAAAQAGQIMHLSDLMLRRVRPGILLSEGGRAYLDRVEALCRPVLDWDKKRWAAERSMYMEYWDYVHSVPL
ncbi:MAG: glycerol-3-phosphate dehydrogenase/oxidase [Desulfobacteraceae bacterium]|nr:glycerol-3-phosphate dehydrogenase/oxidase [Desulfobacteraceae bacterium]